MVASLTNFFRRRGTQWGLFVLGCTLSVVTALWVQAENHEKDELQFSHNVSAVINHVQSRFQHPVFGLQGLRGLYASSNKVSHAQFMAYVQSRDLRVEFPGVRGFAFVQQVPKAALNRFVAAQRADGPRPFTVRHWTDTPFPDMYVVTSIGPPQDNPGAEGLDLGSEPVRRTAIQRAVDTGEPSITAALTLTQDGIRKPGLLLFLPVYIHDAAPKNTKERRLALRGLLGSPILIDELLEGMPEVQDGLLDFELFDGIPDDSKSTLLFDADKHLSNVKSDYTPRFSTVRALSLRGQEFTLRVRSTFHFDTQSTPNNAWLTLAGGCLLSALLALLLKQQASARERAEERALEMTRELQLQKMALDQHAIVTISDAQRRFIYVNDKFCKITGYSQEELLGSTFSIIDSGVHPPEFYEIAFNTIAAGRTWYGEVCSKAKDGSLFWVDSTVLPIMDREGRLQQYLSVRTDITTRKQVELDLIEQQLALEQRVIKRTAELQLANAQAEAANRAKSDFLANMSHEIRTPMNGVVGMVDILQETALQPEQLRMLSTIKNSSMTLLHIVNDILDFSKIEAGKLEVEQVPLHLSNTAGEIVQVLTSHHANRSQVSLDIAPELPTWIMGDPTRLRQVLMNLVSNALKFSSTNANVTPDVRLKLTACAMANGAPGLRLDVMDNGIGMRPEVMSKLFKPFTQADNSTSRKFGGSGLGLSISQRLVALMGGHISVQSAEGKGSTFTVVIPLRVAPHGETTNGMDVAPQGLPLTAQRDTASSQHLILLAEDNETNRDVIQEQLRLLGYACEIAEDGLQALRMWQDKPGRYALLLTDCHMPQLDGFGLTQAIRAAERSATQPVARLPIVAVTANAMQGEAERCMAQGMDDYLSKPLRIRELREVLDKWLAKTPPHLAPGPSFQQQLLQNFLRHAEQQIEALRSAPQNVDSVAFDALADKTYALQCDALSVGATALAHQCQVLGACARAGDAAAFRTHLSALTPALQAFSKGRP